MYEQVVVAFRSQRVSERACFSSIHRQWQGRKASALNLMFSLFTARWERDLLGLDSSLSLSYPCSTVLPTLTEQGQHKYATYAVINWIVVMLLFNWCTTQAIVSYLLQVPTDAHGFDCWMNLNRCCYQKFFIGKCVSSAQLAWRCICSPILVYLLWLSYFLIGSLQVACLFRPIAVAKADGR